MSEELPKEDAERRAREVAHRMLTTPKPKREAVEARESGPEEAVARSQQDRKSLPPDAP